MFKRFKRCKYIHCTDVLSSVRPDAVNITFYQLLETSQKPLTFFCIKITIILQHKMTVVKHSDTCVFFN